MDNKTKIGLLNLCLEESNQYNSLMYNGSKRPSDLMIGRADGCLSMKLKLLHFMGYKEIDDEEIQKIIDSLE